MCKLTLRAAHRSVWMPSATLRQVFQPPAHEPAARCGALTRSCGARRWQARGSAWRSRVLSACPRAPTASYANHPRRSICGPARS
eukprot:1242419-Rhodomonas_salina.3